ncbi:hypothetical protein, partial [Hymenobacter terricola]|uniref:hypothetical protein n=1 Tax=Hymenobacter terricola TaxID=2819236 RepID=UPI001CF538FB
KKNFRERLRSDQGQTARPYGDSPPVDKLEMVASVPKKASDIVQESKNDEVNTPDRHYPADSTNISGFLILAGDGLASRSTTTTTV